MATATPMHKLLEVNFKRKKEEKFEQSQPIRTVRNPGRDIFFQYLPEKKSKQKELERKSKQ